MQMLGPPPPYSSIAQTVTAQPQPLNATFVPFQPLPEPKENKCMKCFHSVFGPCIFCVQVLGCFAEVCFAVCDCREV
ncbi:hypothetical protein CAEBREN_03983 [Caenorhabditis brenneri]|uniref:LITAF domain-containing protein n=1 Tax=Caenorhabditis brenneri TaxID=135651 RepID=G0MXD1_CAEBE|nr:hypothetical protein CAEBREN_03983 [Caenorhabditis brenneri]